MKFKLQFSSKGREIYSKINLFFGFFIIDFVFTLIFNMIFFIPVTLIIDEVYFILHAGETEVPEAFSVPILIALAIIELIVIIIAECKKRNVYVRLDYRGVYICNYNLMRFQSNQWYKLNATLKFYDIENCYTMIPIDVPKNYLYQYFEPFRMTSRHLGLSHKPYYVPAIASGRYDEECVLLELKNGKTVVLPIDDCDEFVSLFYEYADKYNSNSC